MTMISLLFLCLLLLFHYKKCNGQTNNNNVMEFNGINEYIEISDTSTFHGDLEKQLTIEAWINPSKPRGQHTYNTIVSKINAIDNIGMWLTYLLRNGKNSIDFQVGKDNTNHLAIICDNIGDDIFFNKWTHIAGAYNGNNAFLFINGSLCTSGIYNQGFILPSEFPFRIAAAGDDLGLFKKEKLHTNVKVMRSLSTAFDGLISEVRLWKMARTSQQIQQYMNIPISSINNPSNFPNLVGYWRLNQIINGNQIQDLSQYGNDGTIVGNPSLVPLCVENVDCGFGYHCNYRNGSTLSFSNKCQIYPEYANIQQQLSNLQNIVPHNGINNNIPNPTNNDTSMILLVVFIIVLFIIILLFLLCGCLYMVHKNKNKNNNNANNMSTNFQSRYKNNI